RALRPAISTGSPETKGGARGGRDADGRRCAPDGCARVGRGRRVHTSGARCKRVIARGGERSLMVSAGRYAHPIDAKTTSHGSPRRGLREGDFVTREITHYQR